MAQSIFRDRPRFEKLQKIIRAAGFGADAGKFQTAERLALDDRAGDAAIDIKIADAKFPARLFDMRRRARKDAAGQSKLRIVGNFQRLIEVFGFDAPPAPGRKSLPGRCRLCGSTSRKIAGPTKYPLCGAAISSTHLASCLPIWMYSAMRLLRFRFDHRADGIARIFRRADLETARSFDQPRQQIDRDIASAG